MIKRVAVFPGSFDPFTRGHQDIVDRACQVFDEVIIGVGQNASKKRYFELEFMIEKIESTYINNSQVKVTAYQGLTAKFAKENNAQYILRGLRNTTDFEYENAIAQGNKKVNPELETVFLITSPKYAYISSSITRELHRYGEDVSDFIPYPL